MNWIVQNDMKFLEYEIRVNSLDSFVYEMEYYVDVVMKIQNVEMVNYFYYNYDHFLKLKNVEINLLKIQKIFQLILFLIFLLLHDFLLLLLHHHLPLPLHHLLHFLFLFVLVLNISFLDHLYNQSHNYYKFDLHFDYFLLVLYLQKLDYLMNQFYHHISFLMKE